MRILVIAVALAMTLHSASLFAQDKVEARWSIPNCPKGTQPGKTISTGQLRYLLPRGAVVKDVTDVDYHEYFISLNRNGRESLQLWAGVSASPFPPEVDIATSESYSHRAVELPNGVEGIDARGISVIEGVKTRWRNAGVLGEFATYSKASAESAGHFDAIINSVCYQQEH